MVLEYVNGTPLEKLSSFPSGHSRHRLEEKRDTIRLIAKRFG
jgi:hypothetical protein